MLRRVLFIGLLGCLLVGGASAYLAGYGYYQDATVNNTGSALSYYSLNFTVNTSSGTSSGTTIYLNSHSESDLDDLRFTDTSDNIYPYWIGSAASPYTIWVNATSIPVGNSTIRVQYGNAGASSASNGTTTFKFFDDFIGASLDTTTKWTVIQNNGLSVGSGLFTVSSGAANYGEIRTQSSYGPDIVLMFNISVATYYTGLGFGAADNSGSGSSIGLVKQTGYESAIFTGAINADGNWIPPRSYSSSSTSGDTITDPTSGVYYIEEFGIPNGTKLIERRNSGAWTTSTRYNGINASTPLHIAHYRNTAALNLDWIAIRNYAATPPTVPAWSGESTTTIAPVAAFSANRTTGAPGNILFTDASTNTPTSWQWSFGDGTANSTDQNPVHTYAAGTFTVSLTATNDVGSDVETKTNYITLTNPPVAAFHANVTSGLAPLHVLFTDDSTNSPSSWVWDVNYNTGTDYTTQNPVHTYSSAGTYSVKLTSTNAGGSDDEIKNNYIVVTVLTAFPGCSNPPTDIDADGYCEDINGNTRADWSDLILFFTHLAWAQSTEPQAYFDFANDGGTITYADVKALFEEL